MGKVINVADFAILLEEAMSLLPLPVVEAEEVTLEDILQRGEDFQLEVETCGDGCCWGWREGLAPADLLRELGGRIPLIEVREGVAHLFLDEEYREKEFPFAIVTLGD